MASTQRAFLDLYKELGLVVTAETDNGFFGPCPFHAGDTKSELVVHKKTGAFRCLSCHKGGGYEDYCKFIFGQKVVVNGAAESKHAISQALDTAEQAVIQAVEFSNLIELADSGKAEFIGKKLRFKATSAGKDLQPYASPKKILFNCKMGLKICGACSIYHNNGTLEHEIKASSMDVLRMLDVNEEHQKEFMRRSAGIVPKCPRFEMAVKEHHTIEDIRLMPEINFSSSADTEYTMKQAYHVGPAIRTNMTYEFEGSPVPDPKDQHITYLLDKAEPVQDSIDTFKMTPEVYDQLKVFQIRRKDDSIEEKINDITTDLTNNVTRIYMRNDLITAIDLIYHSILYFKFQGKTVGKGWTEALIIGDTRCGKTETVTRLVEHYKAGEISTGENCSYAGLVGGLQQTGSRWAITWGKLPLNDKRLFIIDEISGMPVEDIGKMSGVRSSGLAEITKVQTEKTFARTRLLWVGNPRSTRPLGSYDTGVQAIPELIGRPEDIARFDFAISVMSGDVPLTVVNRIEQPETPHVYTSELCHKLIVWAWSRKPYQIHFTKEAEKLCLELSLKMGSMYSSQIPLVEPAELRIKLARLSVACAARLFATTTGEDLVVGVEHIQFVYAFLNRIYGAPSMNYTSFSAARIMAQNIKDVSVIETIIKSHGPALIDGLLSQQYFRLNDFEDLFDMEKRELKGIISQLVRNRAIKHYNTAYVKTPAFITLLRKTQAEGVMEKPKLPEADY